MTNVEHVLLLIRLQLRVDGESTLVRVLVESIGIWHLDVWQGRCIYRCLVVDNLGGRKDKGTQRINLVSA